MPSEVEEIEAILRDQIVIRRMGEHGFMEGFEETAAAIAALRSQDRGAREMRERAALLCQRASERANLEQYSAYARGDTDGTLHASVRARHLSGMTRNIRALPLSPVRTEDGRDA